MWGLWALTQLPGLLLVQLALPLAAVATAPQPAITPTEEHMQAISLMETWSIALTSDDLYTKCIEPHRSAQSTTQTSVYMRVWLAPHQLLQRSGWAIITEWTVTSWKLAPRSSSLSLCISVSPHHSGGRPTKAFVLQWAVQQKLHKHADSVLLTEGEKEIEKSRETAKTEEGGKRQLWKRKGSVKMFVVCVCVCLRES